MSETVFLSMKPLLFYSKLDEVSFVRNLESIKSIKNINRIDKGMNISIDKSECDWNEFKDIMSLFIRYNLDLKMLLDIVPDAEVKAWFISPERGWHSRL